MTPSARLQAAIDILDELSRTNAPADRFMREWFRARRYAGSKDRAAVGERVFSILRHRASLAWRMGSEAPRALAIASVLAESDDAANIDALFSGGSYGAPPLTEEERAAIGSPARASPPLSVQGEFPEWLEPELARSLGDALLPEMRANCERASIDLRANTLKATRENVLDALHEAGFAAGPTPFAPDCIRIARDTRLSALSQMPAFEDGWFEFQDEAAQIASVLCAAKPGMRILDLAAGAGGKSLALAALMRNDGEIVACDIDDARLGQLGPRAARSGVSIISSHVSVSEPPEGPFDAALVDAPCSGTGTWRRQPELRWRLAAEKLAALNVLQDKLLDQAASRVRKGGRLIYATCSLLKCENDDRIDAFTARHPDFIVRDIAEIWRESTPLPRSGRFFKASPLTTATDGFFAAVMERT
jgi:16S rRNA (cytosine967-C5)-methyltransferase